MDDQEEPLGVRNLHQASISPQSRVPPIAPTPVCAPVGHISLSHVAPDKAQEIRSAVTGALSHHKRSGLFCFEQIVETTFVLPWDLSPLVEPERLSVRLRDGIRGELLDHDTAVHLESSGTLNWNLNAVWQFEEEGNGWTTFDSVTCQELERGYAIATEEPLMLETTSGTWQVDFVHRIQTSAVSGRCRPIRRLACAPLMPMKTEHSDVFSLFHAASLGFWGVNDRTNLLRDAVIYSLDDAKAQFVLFSCWQQTMSRNLPPGCQPPSFPEWEQAKQDLVANPQLHIFTLANVVLRPIIVYASPQSHIGGIYLPLLWEDRMGRFPCDQHPQLKNPLPLAYNAEKGKFSALVTFRGTKGPLPILLPLMHNNTSVFHVHFLSNAQVTQPEAILKRLMNLDILSSPIAGSPCGSPVKAPENVFGTGVIPLFGRRASSFTEPSFTVPAHSCPPTLTAFLDAPELPEVIDSLIKRYQKKYKPPDHDSIEERWDDIAIMLRERLAVFSSASKESDFIMEQMSELDGNSFSHRGLIQCKLPNCLLDLKDGWWSQYMWSQYRDRWKQVMPTCYRHKY